MFWMQRYVLRTLTCCPLLTGWVCGECSSGCHVAEKGLGVRSRSATWGCAHGAGSAHGRPCASPLLTRARAAFLVASGYDSRWWALPVKPTFAALGILEVNELLSIAPCKLKCIRTKSRIFSMESHQLSNSFLHLCYILVTLRTWHEGLSIHSSFYLMKW